jgi:chromosome segregation ATPase
LSLTRTQEQLIEIEEENASMRSERAELHSLLNDTAQELEQHKKALAEAEGATPSYYSLVLSNILWLPRNA